MGGGLDVDSSGGRHACSHGAVRLRSRSAGSLSGCKIRLAEVHRQPGTCRWGVGLTMKAKIIAYWTTTILVAFFIGSGGVAQLAQYQGNPHGVVPVLGYPMYFFAILGFWKVLGAIAILVPRFSRLKEWAYAGIFFDLTGAAASCAAVGGYGAYAFHVLAPLFLAVLAVVSWALRPQSRTIGVRILATRSVACID